MGNDHYINCYSITLDVKKKIYIYIFMIRAKHQENDS